MFFFSLDNLVYFAIWWSSCPWKPCDCSQDEWFSWWS